MLCKDENSEIPYNLFTIEFEHHMRRHCGGTWNYKDQLYSVYAGLIGVDVGHIALVAAGEIEPCSKILDAMDVDLITYVEKRFKERAPVLDSD